MSDVPTCRLVHEIEDIWHPTVDEIMAGEPFPLGDDGDVDIRFLPPEDELRHLVIYRDDDEPWATGQDVEVYPVMRRGLQLVVCDEPAIHGAVIA